MHEPPPFPAEPQPLSLFDAEGSNQTLLKLPGAVTLTSRSEDRVSPALTDGLEKLVELVADLRSPGGGWQSDLPQTPEHLLPYVTEEMGDVLNALEDEKSAELREKERTISASEAIVALDDDLLSLLLWHLARSAEDMTRLLAGIEAKVTSADGTWNRGILRLIASLTLKTSQTQEAIDLATHHPPQFNLPAEAMVQSFDCRFSQHPLDTESLLRKLQDTIDRRLPAIARLSSQSIAVLSPGQNWQVGRLSLTLGFEFLQGPPTADRSFESETSSESELTPTALLSTQLKLTDTVVLSRYVRESIRQQLAVPLKQLFLGDREYSSGASADALDRFLLRTTWDFVERVYSGSPSPEPQLVPPQMNLGRLTSKLLWHMVQSRRATVRLIGGISARVLQPGYRWERGTVRLVAILSADFTGSHWEIDVTTRERPELMGTLLAEDAIIDWKNCDRRPRLQEIGSALAEIAGQFRDVSPELGIWMDGVEVDWGEPTSEERVWRYASEARSRSGLVQLVLGLEWVPISSPASERANVDPVLNDIES